ncbi:asparaginase domain-containing protein [Paracoccus nototheniae]|uniref:Asparaginase domain-containing protein n=1 Tax=Paracoccus nototheniae TaxID=2489002 RepID=A0ABW4DUB0_9RHOB|nr:asparaginase domain-containing protein [Paracoccus nototheniae]
MRICVINTGGTICCTGTPLAPMAPQQFAQSVTDLLGDALAAALPGDRVHIDHGLRFSDEGPGVLDSTDLRPSDWALMAGRVLDLYDDHDAFVILHGTDTMDYTGAALPLLLNVFDDLGLPCACLSKPVILTGAQLPLFVRTPQGLFLNAASDGLANLTGALQATRLRLPEVAVFFDGKLLRGSRALKVSTTRFAAFDSPHLPPLAEGGIGLHSGPAQRLPGPADPALALDAAPARALVRAQLDAIAAVIDDQRIAQIPAIPADHRACAPLMAQMIGTALASGATGLLLEGFGEGNIPAGGGAVQAALTDAQVPVLIASRAIGGQVGAFHYAAGAWIAATGAIATGDMTPVAALAKLMILNALSGPRGWDRRVLAALLTRSLTGECAATDRLDGPLRPGQAIRAADGDARLDNDPDSGPRFSVGGQILWQAPGPGTLAMRDNRLVLIAPDGGVLWTSPAAAPGAVAILTAHPPALRLFDAARLQAPLTVLPC